MSNPFDLVWNGEVIDEAADIKEARYLQGEYAMAYGGSVTIKRVHNRCANGACDVAIPVSRSLCRDCENAAEVEFGP